MIKDNNDKPFIRIAVFIDNKSLYVSHIVSRTYHIHVLYNVLYNLHYMQLVAFLEFILKSITIVHVPNLLKELLNNFNGPNKCFNMTVGVTG